MYQVGVSSGFWQIRRDPALLGLAQKTGFIATAGVTFNQVDLESIAEFLEPRVKENIKRLKKELGLKIGLHAEIGELTALESAERRVWEQSHGRLVETVKNAVDIGIVYINFHLSSTGLLQFEESRIRPFGFQYQVVSPEGTPFWKFADRSSHAKDYVKKIIVEGHMGGMIRREAPFREKVEAMKKTYQDTAKKRGEEYVRRLKASLDYGKLSPAEQRIAEETERSRAAREVNAEFNNELTRLEQDADFLYDIWKKSTYAQYVLEAGEIDAYMTVASHMSGTGDILWSQIAKGAEPERAYIEAEHAFNAAVAARYIEGHLRVKDNPFNKNVLEGKSVLEWAQKNNLILTFEMPEIERVPEGAYRLFDPRHAYWFIKKINSPVVKLCIDFEHMLAQRLDPYKVIPELPDDVGKQIYLFHLGEPKPYQGKAHIPIPLGSQAQEVIYEWLYMLRKKGFKDGILIFERGGGRTGGGQSTFEVYEHSVIALKLIAKYLEAGTNPKNLPMEFYGMSEKNEPEYKRELVEMRNHAWDPLEGVLSVPEEKHTFLSAAAVAKQKGPEWEKRKFR